MAVSREVVEGHIESIKAGIAGNTLDHKVYGDGAAATKKLHALESQLSKMS